MKTIKQVRYVQPAENLKVLYIYNKKKNKISLLLSQKILFYSPWPEKLRMAQIARELPNMVNCAVWGILFYGQGSYLTTIYNMKIYLCVCMCVCVPSSGSN